MAEFPENQRGTEHHFIVITIKLTQLKEKNIQLFQQNSNELFKIKKRKLPNDSTEMGSKISVVEIDTTKNKIFKIRAQGSSSSSSTVSMTSTSQKQQQPSTHSNLVNQISTIQTPTSTQKQHHPNQQSNYIISAETHSQKFLPLKLLVNKTAPNTTTSTSNFNHNHQKQQHSTTGAFDLIEMKNIFTPTSTSPTMLNTDSNSYYKSVDNISELDSIDYPSDQDEFMDDDEAITDSGECDRDVIAATVSLNRRKRSDSNCENFVLIIDNVTEQKQCQSNSVKPVETKRHNDVILSVLNISHGSNNEKGYL